MKVLLSAEDIQRRVEQLGADLARDYESKSLTIIGVLTGSLLFVADLIRQLSLPVRVGFIQASSYRGAETSPGDLQIFPQLLPPIGGQDVLIADDILDTGRTMIHLRSHFVQMKPASLKIAVLLRKKARLQVDLEPDYCGFDIPDKFVVGYGLDFNDHYRNLPYIAELDRAMTPGSQ